MRRGKELLVKIDKTEFPSIGVTTNEDRKIYVKNAFPGQTVLGKVKKNRPGKTELKLIEVVEKADYEIQPRCPHFGVCGGCSSQNLSYEKQLELLETEVKELFADECVSMGKNEGIVGSRLQYEYRNKMEFTFGDEQKGGILNVGMHMRNKSFGIVNVSECCLVDNDYRKIIDATVNYFREKEIDGIGKLPYYRVMKREGFLRHLIIRKAKNTNEIMVNIVTTTQIDFDFSEYVDVLKGIDYDGKLVSVLHTENNSFSDAVIPEKVNLLFGRDYITEDLLGLKFKISPFSFFQTNTKGAEELYSIVREYVSESDNKTVFDLYCGTGTIGQIVAAKAKKVVGIELIEEAVEAAKENAKLNNLTNCDFLAGDVAEIIKTIHYKPDLIILDPPRSGVSKDAMKYVINFNAEEIVYVSCNPKTLVKDLKVLEEAGYVIQKTRIKDMFPNTPHVETVVKMVKEA